MSDIHPYHLGKLVHAMLGTEYGPSERTEPTFPDARAGPAGEAAVAGALAPKPPRRNQRAKKAGEAAVDAELNKPPDVASEAFQGERNPRAQAWGESALGNALTGPANAAGTQAVGAALFPPTDIMEEIKNKTRSRLRPGQEQDPPVE